MQYGDDQYQEAPRHRVPQGGGAYRHHAHLRLHQVEIRQYPCQYWESGDGQAQPGKEQKRGEGHLFRVFSVTVENNAPPAAQKERKDDPDRANQD